VSCGESKCPNEVEEEHTSQHRHNPNKSYTRKTRSRKGVIVVEGKRIKKNGDYLKCIKI